MILLKLLYENEKEKKITKANSSDNENITFPIFDARRLIKEFLKKKNGPPQQ